MSLYDFKDDDITDFVGHDVIEVEEKPEKEDMSWLYPEKGPGKFKKKKKKKSKKRVPKTDL